MPLSRNFRQLAACGVVALALIGASCGAHRAALAPAQPGTELAQAAPAPLALPAPAGLDSRAAAFTPAEGHLLGKDFDALKPLNRVTPSGNAALFSPDLALAGGQTSAAGLAYAIYDFHLPNYTNELVDIDFDWAATPGQGTGFFGLGDFAANRWRWFSLPAGNTMAFSNFAAYRNASQHCFLVVALTGTTSATLNDIQVAMKLAPTADLTADVDSGLAPLAVQFDASGSFDIDGTLTNYEWDFDGDGFFNESGAEFNAEGSAVPPAYVYNAAGTFDAAVRVTDNDGKTATAVRQINVSLTQPPVAGLTAPVITGPEPLDVDFDATSSFDPDGTITHYEWDFDGDNVFGEAGAEAAAADNPTPATVTYSVIGVYHPQVRVTDNDNNKDVQAISITVTNIPPLADLQAVNADGPAPLVVTFDASASSDPGGTITDYEWDFDGDGVFNEAGAELTARGSATPADYTYMLPGDYHPVVRVTDDHSITDTATLTVSAHGWKVLTVDDSLADDGYNVNLALQNGKPVICHCTLSPYGMRLARSSTATGDSAADWTGALVLDSSFNPTHCSFALIGGKPAVSFFADIANYGLYYTRSSTTTGMSALDWSTPLDIDLTDTAGLSSNLREVSGAPAIAYNAVSAGDLRYAFSTQADGSSGWSSLVIDGDGSAGPDNVGGHLSLELVDGNPAVAYTAESPSTGLLYIRSATSSGAAIDDWTTNGTHTTIYTDIAGDTYPSLKIVNGNPAVSFMDSFSTLRYAICTSADGSAVWNASFVDSNPITGEFSSLAVVNGFPSIAYHSQTDDLPLFASSNAVDGDGDATWASVGDIVTTTTNGRFTSLVELSTGQPAVAYRDDGSGLLQYAVLY